MENRTISYYSSHAEEYANSTWDARMSGIYSHFIPLLKERSSILDLGCGSGRDTAYFISKGFSVTAVDGTPELCRIAEQNTGCSVRCMLFEDLDYIDAFDGVWACSSLLHVKKESLPDIFRKIHRALRNNGYFYSSFKYGDAECERSGRDFTDLNAEEFLSIATGAGFSPVDIFITGDARIGREHEKWLNAIVKKAMPQLE